MYCKKCGAEIVDGGRFCSKCGSMDFYTKEGDAPSNTACSTQSDLNCDKKDKNKQSYRKIIGIGLIILLIGAGIGALFGGKGSFGKNNSDEKKLEEKSRSDEAKAEIEGETEDILEEKIIKKENEGDGIDKGESTEEEQTVAEDITDSVVGIEEEVRDVTPAIDMSKVDFFTASSTLKWNGIEYPAYQIADGSLEKAWQEGAEGFGIGESISLIFDNTYRVSGMVINAGYQKSSDLYYENGRPKDILITFSDGNVQRFFLEDCCEEQVITFDSPIDTSFVQIKILSVYEGEKYEDTSISEVYLY